jgi:hypothetical protein
VIARPLEDSVISGRYHAIIGEAVKFLDYLI